MLTAIKEETFIFLKMKSFLIQVWKKVKKIKF